MLNRTGSKNQNCILLVAIPLMIMVSLIVLATTLWSPCRANFEQRVAIVDVVARFDRKRIGDETGESAAATPQQVVAIKRRGVDAASAVVEVDS
jgi:hypothetical protein